MSSPTSFPVTLAKRAIHRSLRSPRVRKLHSRWLLSGTEPVDRHWGIGRGKPIDRLYIERFLTEQANHIRGRVLEIGGDYYARAFAGAPIDRVEVLDVVPGDKVTIIGDLAQNAGLADDSFDSLVVLQTLMMIHDIGAAVDCLHRILKPGGTALVTVNFIAPNCDDPCQDMWQWNVSPSAAERLFVDRFGAGNVEITSYGNYFAAASLLAGLAAEDIDESDLWTPERGYEVIVGIRATKAT